MSLKDEIEKLIQSEQQKIEERNQKHVEYHERQQQRFSPLRAVLEELVVTVAPEYLNANIYNDHATLEVGRKQNDYFRAEIRWEIEPDYDVKFGTEKGESLFYEKLGFRIEKKEYFNTPEFDVSECTQIFKTEQETAQHLIKQIAEKVAHYRHLEDIATQRKKHSNPPNNG